MKHLVNIGQHRTVKYRKCDINYVELCTVMYMYVDVGEGSNLLRDWGNFYCKQGVIINTITHIVFVCVIKINGDEWN